MDYFLSKTICIHVKATPSSISFMIIPYAIAITIRAASNTSVQYITRLVQGYRQVGLPIIHVIRLYSKDDSNVDLCRRKAIENGKQLVIPGSDGAELRDVLKPSPQITLDSKLLLSGNLQQIGSMEWIMDNV